MFVFVQTVDTAGCTMAERFNSGNAFLFVTFAVIIVLGCERDLNLRTAAASNMITSFVSAVRISGEVVVSTMI